MIYCTQCGAANADDAGFCTSCGAPISASNPVETQNPQPQSENKKSALVSAFSGNLFLAICVLISIATAISFDAVHLLFAIFCWIIYYNAKKDELSVPMMRAVSGTVFAGRIIYFVGAAALLFSAGIVLLCALVIPPEVVAEIQSAYGELIAILEQEGVPAYALEIVMGLLGYGIKKLLGLLVGFLATMGVYLLALGIIWGGIHKFTKELYTKAETGAQELVHAKKCATCMMVAGVVMAAFALFEVAISFSSTVPALLTAATMIVGSVFVKNNFNG